MQSLCHSFRSNYQKLGAFARHERRKWRRAPSKACALFVISGSDVHRDVQRRYLDRGGRVGGSGVYIKRVLCKFFDPLNVPPSSPLHRQPPFRISPLVTEPSNGVKRAPITHPSSPNISSRIVTIITGYYVFSMEISSLEKCSKKLSKWNKI